MYKLFKALKHQVEKGPVDAKMKKAKYTLNDTGLLGDDVEYSVLVSTHGIHTNTVVFFSFGRAFWRPEPKNYRFLDFFRPYCENRKVSEIRI